MANIDLRNYVVLAGSSGTWMTDTVNSYTANRLVLRAAGDAVTLVGPLRVHVTFQTINQVFMLGAAGNGLPVEINHDLYSYDLQVPPAHSWTYTVPDTVPPPGATAPPSAVSLMWGRLGTNDGMRLQIEPAGMDTSQCPPPEIKDCLPCDFAVANIPDTSKFFPIGCEPCPTGVPVGLPPGTVPSLAIPSAMGGCVRTRFFNGMFVTSEDLETEQRYLRLKLKLHNRASGAGVVWGFDLARSGSAICVSPGYGVDCCGNDLTITTPYKVDIAALLRDPAAVLPTASIKNPRPPATDASVYTRGSAAYRARTRGTFASRAATDLVANVGRPARMHLLLEYIECPQDPRPVHGDPCGPDLSRCEMSRIRETVRLRLVPPRDLDLAGPIADFLAALGPSTPTVSNPPGGVGTVGPIEAPYQIEVSFTDANGMRQAGSLTPTGVPQTLQFPLGPNMPPVSANLRLITDGDYGFVNGTLQEVVAGGSPVVIDTVHHPLDFEMASTAPITINFPGSRRDFALVDGRVLQVLPPWSTRRRTVSASITLEVPQIINGGGNELVMTVTGTVDNEEVVLDPAPCRNEPCTPADTEMPLFPVAPPWMHEDPRRQGSAADPKVLGLGLLYSWLSSELVRHRTGTPTEVWTAQRSAADLIYQGAWALFFDVGDKPDRDARSTDLANLMSDWCSNFLYRGPVCNGEPHGVVIGCALVAGGDIQEVHPWDGRRWVVHYPLLEHWGKNIGITPPDVTASRIFSLICCIAGLPEPAEPDLTPFPLGDGYLLFAREWSEVDRRLREYAIADAATVLSERRISFFDFIGEIVDAFRGSSQPPPYAELIVHTLDSSQSLRLVRPPGASRVSTPRPSAPPPP